MNCSDEVKDEDDAKFKSTKSRGEPNSELKY